MISCMIDTIEGQDLATAEIPVDFLQTYYNKGGIHVKMDGAIVTLLKYIDPAYYKDFIYIYISMEINECMQNPIRLYKYTAI